ncbi:MAG: DUF4440 domain-containing protein [Acidobacteria bacterium]|nr:DUF4440 domain-containing protein [Acidobacteriota bacterium]
MRLLVFCLATLTLSAQSPDRDKIVTTVQRTFDAMAAKDAAAFRAELHPAAQFFSVRPDGTMNVSTVDQFAARLPDMKEGILERMWKPEVRVSGRLAAVWTEYDFHRGGKFSHCGIDAIHLMKGADGAWKITSIAYDVNPTGCVPSPLGPPKN